MSLLDELEAKEAAGKNGASAKATPPPSAPRPGMDPAKVREAYDKAESAPAAESASAPAPAPAPESEPPGPPLASGVELPTEVQEQLAEGERVEGLFVTTDPPLPKGKKGIKETGLIRLAVADEKTGRLVLHAIGLALGKSVEEVEAHAKALYP